MISLIIRLGLVGVFALAALSSNIETKETNIDTTGVVLGEQELNKTDERVTILAEFLNGYDSPLAGEAETFVKVADEYGLDWRFLPAISGVESLFGNRVAPNTYNPFGWGGGYIEFKSWSEAIETVGKTLGERGQKASISTPEEWAPTYCPPNAKNWSRGVRYFMNELETLKREQSQA